MKKILLFVVISLVFCACDEESAAAVSPKSVQNQNFIIAKLEIAGKTLVPSPLQDENSSISFDATQYNGFAACNGFFGSFTIKNDKIRFNESGGATKMMCPPEVMAFEDELLSNLYGEFGVESEGESLVLKSSKIKIFLLPKKLGF